MIEVMIIDDNFNDALHLEKLLSDFLESKNVDFKIKKENIFESNIAVYDGLDFLFLDIDLGEKNGIEFAKKIRDENKDLNIILTSKLSEYLIDGYSVDAKRYFLKPIEKSIFYAEMENVLGNQFNKTRGFIEPSISKNKIYYHDILYVEFVDRWTLIHFTNGMQVQTKFPLKYWVNKLKDYNFCMPYRCYMVNLEYVSGISYDERDIFLVNNEKIPMSKLYKKTFTDLYFEYLIQSL